MQTSHEERSSFTPSSSCQLVGPKDHFQVSLLASPTPFSTFVAFEMDKCSICSFQSIHQTFVPRSHIGHLVRRRTQAAPKGKSSHTLETPIEIFQLE